MASECGVWTLEPVVDSWTLGLTMLQLADKYRVPYRTIATTSYCNLRPPGIYRAGKK